MTLASAPVFQPLDIATDRCKGCGLCVAVCPKGVLALDLDTLDALGYHPVQLTDATAAVPCTALARTAGHDRLVSVVALGALLARRPLVSAAAIRDALAAIVGTKHADLLEADLAAFDAGLRAGARDALAERQPAGAPSG